MEFLVLINNGQFVPLYKCIAIELQRRGYRVVVATDSSYTRELHDLDSLNCDIWVFSDFFRKFNYNGERNESDLKWRFHADFDRGDCYGFSNQFSAEKLERLSAALDSFFNKLMDFYKITDVFYEKVSNGFSEWACATINERGGRYHGLTASRLPGMALFSRRDSDVRCHMQSVMDRDVIGSDDLEWARCYLSKLLDVEPDYMASKAPMNNIDQWKRVFRKRKISNLLLLLKYSKKSCSRYQFQVGRPAVTGLHSNLRLLARRFRRARIQGLYSDPPSGRTLYLYPLHYHPEASTSIGARYYDEFNVIKNIAFSLGANEWLVVKDHLMATGYEKMSFYKKVAALPNVTFLKPEVNSRRFLSKCKGVITLTSTVGYEAVLLGVPVLVLGDVFYDVHKLVKKVSGFDDISESLNHLRADYDIDSLVDYNEKFVVAYKKCCFPMRLNLAKPWGELEEDAQIVVDELIKSQKQSVKDESYHFEDFK